jgi:hypothetical protein
VEGGVAIAAIALYCRIRRDRIWRVTGKCLRFHQINHDWFYSALEPLPAPEHPIVVWRLATRRTHLDPFSHRPISTAVASVLVGCVAVLAADSRCCVANSMRTATVQRLTGVYKNLSHGIVALVYRCHSSGGATRMTAEAREVRWMTREEVEAAMDPAFAVRVLDAFADDAHSRAHDGVNLVSG